MQKFFVKSIITALCLFIAYSSEAVGSRIAFIIIAINVLFNDLIGKKLEARIVPIMQKIRLIHFFMLLTGFILIAILSHFISN